MDADSSVKVKEHPLDGKSYAPSVPRLAYGVVGESAVRKGSPGEEGQAGQEC